MNLTRSRHLTLRALALAALGAVAWITLAGRAQGGPVDDDGVPKGTMAFFTGGACPAGWTTASNVQGRLVVGVTDGAHVGMQVGTPLTDREDRAHHHTYSGPVALTAKNIAAGDGSNQNGAAAQSYTVSGATDDGPSGLPFVQVQPCEKQ
jgi:hypothetical protein